MSPRSNEPEEAKSVLLRQRVRPSTLERFRKCWDQYRHPMGYDSVDDFIRGLLDTFEASQVS